MSSSLKLEKLLLISVCMLLCSCAFAKQSLDKTVKSHTEMDEEFLDNLIETQRDPEFAINLKAFKRNLFEPEKLLEDHMKETKIMDMETFVKTYTDSPDLEHLLSANSIANSLNYMIKFYNKGVFILHQLDDHLGHEYLLGKYNNHIEEMKQKSSQVKSLIDQAESCLEKLKKSKAKPSRSELLNQFKSLLFSKKQLDEHYPINETLSVTIGNFITQGQTLAEECGIIAEMVDDVSKHSTAFMLAINVQTIDNLNFKVNPLDFDLNVILELLNLHQDFETLQNNFELETNLEESQSTNDFKILIDDYTEKHKNEIFSFVYALTEIVMKIGSKALMAADLRDKLIVKPFEWVELMGIQGLLNDKIYEASQLLWKKKDEL